MTKCEPNPESFMPLVKEVLKQRASGRKSQIIRITDIGCETVAELFDGKPPTEAVFQEDYYPLAVGLMTGVRFEGLLRRSSRPGLPGLTSLSLDRAFPQEAHDAQAALDSINYLTAEEPRIHKVVDPINRLNPVSSIAPRYAGLIISVWSAETYLNAGRQAAILRDYVNY
jgi:hypothetical protein